MCRTSKSSRFKVGCFASLEAKSNTSESGSSQCQVVTMKSSLATSTAYPVRSRAVQSDELVREMAKSGDSGDAHEIAVALRAAWQHLDALRGTPKRNGHPGTPFAEDFQLVGSSDEDLVDPPLPQHLPVVRDLSIDAALPVVDFVCEERGALVDDEAISYLVDEVVQFYRNLAVEAGWIDANPD